MEEQDYSEGFNEYIEGGLREENAKSYRCAVDLYYKALCQLIDYLLYREDIDVNKLKDRLDHIKSLNSNVYDVFAVLHSIYRSAYKARKDKKDCTEVKNGIKKIIFLKGVEGRFKKTIEKM